MSNRPNKRTGKPGAKDRLIREKNAQIRQRGLPLGGRIIKAAWDKGITLSDLPEKLGMDSLDWMAVITEKLPVSPQLAIKLKEVLGIEI